MKYELLTAYDRAVIAEAVKLGFDVDDVSQIQEITEEGVLWLQGFAVIETGIKLEDWKNKVNQNLPDENTWE